MADLENNSNSGNLFRPLLIAFLVGISILLSVFFIASPEAFPQKQVSIESGHPSVDAMDELALEAEEAGPVITVTDYIIEPDDTLTKVLTNFGTTPVEINAITKKARPIYDLHRMTRGSVLNITQQDGALTKLNYQYNDREILILERDAAEADGFKASKQELPVETRLSYVNGTIETSLYEDGIKSGADPNAIMALSDIFAWDIDFATDIRKNDSFSYLAEVLYIDGKPYRTGKILGAEVVNNGKKYKAIYYEAGKGRGSYYDENGKSLSRTLLKSPLRYRRISSHFSRARFHPILKKYRPHHGVDYAAPTGTPVEAAGSGTVAFAGWKGGYGKYIVVKHANGYSTAYGHLSRISSRVRAGSKVSQGDVIGNVGTTGHSTGPHLHYEVRINNKVVNPLSIKSVPGKSLGKKDMQAFAAVRNDIMGRLAKGDTNMASAGVATASARK